MQHSSLENGRWAELTFPQQMANISSETSRVLKALEAGKESRAISAFARFQELIDLTIRYGRLGEGPSARSAMWEDLCACRGHNHRVQPHLSPLADVESGKDQSGC